MIEEGAVAAAPAQPPAAAARRPRRPVRPHPRLPRRRRPPSSPAAGARSLERLDPAQVAGTGRDGRVTKEDLVNFMPTNSGGAQPPRRSAAAPAAAPGAASEERVPMTRMRAKIAERLMQSKNSIAMLTRSTRSISARSWPCARSSASSSRRPTASSLGFMELLRQGRRGRSPEAPPDRQRIGRRQRRHLHHGYQDIGGRRVHRQGPGHAGAARRAEHGLRRHRARSPASPSRRVRAASSWRT